MADAAEAIEIVAADIEQVEQHLQKLIDPEPETDGAATSVDLGELRATMQGMATRLRDANSQLESLADTGELSHEIREQASAALELLQAEFQGASADYNDGVHSREQVTPSTVKLLTACREVRGELTAILFTQMQP
jgi:hypothetical protein